MHGWDLGIGYIYIGPSGGQEPPNSFRYNPACSFVPFVPSCLNFLEQKSLHKILLPSFATLLLCNAPHYPSSRHHTLHEFPEGLHTTRHAHASREQRLLTCLTHIVSTASANPACLLSSEAPSRTCKAVNQLSTASTPKLIRQPLTTLAIAPFSRR